MKKDYIISGIIALCISLGVIIMAPEVIPGLKILKIEHLSGTPVQGAVSTLDENKQLYWVVKKKWQLYQEG